MIVVGMLAAQLATVPEAARAGVLVEALRLAKVSPTTTPEALTVEEQIG